MNWDIFLPNFLCISWTDRSLVPVPQLDISYDVTEELVPCPATLWNKTHQTLDSLTPATASSRLSSCCLLQKVSRTIFGSTRPLQLEQGERKITKQQRAFDPATVPSFSSEQQLLLQLLICAARHGAVIELARVQSSSWSVVVPLSSWRVVVL